MPDCQPTLGLGEGGGRVIGVKGGGSQVGGSRKGIEKNRKKNDRSNRRGGGGGGVRFSRGVLCSGKKWETMLVRIKKPNDNIRSEKAISLVMAGY